MIRVKINYSDGPQTVDVKCHDEDINEKALVKYLKSNLNVTDNECPEPNYVEDKNYLKEEGPFSQEYIELCRLWNKSNLSGIFLEMIIQLKKEILMVGGSAEYIDESE